MAIQQDPEWIDQVFIEDVNELERLGRLEPRKDIVLLRMSAILRKFVADEQPLAFHAERRCTLPLTVLIPEPSFENPKHDPTRTFPSELMRYAPEISENSHPGGRDGWFYASYSMRDYLDRCHMVMPAVSEAGELAGRPITPREMIAFFANKLGGIHVDKNLNDIHEGGRSVDAKTLHEVNDRVKAFGHGVLFQQFGVVGERIWRACAPLRDELISRTTNEADT